MIAVACFSWLWKIRDLDDIFACILFTQDLTPQMIRWVGGLLHQE